MSNWDKIFKPIVVLCAICIVITGALAATMLTDYATPADEDQVWSIYKGNARVKR